MRSDNTVVTLIRFKYINVVNVITVFVSLINKTFNYFELLNLN